MIHFINYVLVVLMAVLLGWTVMSLTAHETRRISCNKIITNTETSMTFHQCMALLNDTGA